MPEEDIKVQRKKKKIIGNKSFAEMGEQMKVWHHTSQNTKLEILAIILIIASFGPYLSTNGIRLEHVCIYTMMPIAMIIVLMRKRSILNYKPIFGIFISLLFMLVWALLVTFLGDHHYESTYKLIADIENNLQPIAILIIMAPFANTLADYDYSKLLVKLSYSLEVLLSINSIIVVAMLFVDLSPYLARFYGDFQNTGASVAANSLTMGRLCGIFNQPMESGLTYSLGIILWVYIINKKNQPILFDYIILMLILVGGCLSVSKVFILGGIPLFLLFLLLTNKIKLLFNWWGLISVITLVSITIYLSVSWNGFDFFMRLFRLNEVDSSGGLQAYVYLFSAGRFGGETTVQTQLHYIANVSPFYGLGLAALTTTDNAYLAYFAQGGIVTLGVYFVSIIIIGRLALSNYGTTEGKLLAIIFILIIGAGLGAPVYTINHFSTVFWVVLPTVCCAIRNNKLNVNKTHLEGNYLIAIRRNPDEKDTYNH